ncbi:hypothetical protein GCM10027275_47800 [Rhabdobacter roseus]|uniref:DUF1761 domain-containing protein n=1 Tax=Rhabdobacter roseus TaxID=1655419 RepID=A0A840TXN1_9BACT|nr:DUF1761 domain-containing protein [Rhabdobacter roseus]MBB5286337.1 hypothetical protein [Rhabdobacter roseus]
MKTLTISHRAVLLCIILGQVIPALWYTLFSEPWMATSGISLADVEANPSPVPYMVSILTTAAVAYTLAWLFTKIPVTSAGQGAATGLWLGTVFVLLETLVKDMFSFRELTLSLINGGVSVVVYTVIGLILGAWRKYVYV